MAKSPYQTTLFMDADFVVIGDSLLYEIESFEKSNDHMRFLRKPHVRHLQLEVRNEGSVWSTLLLYKNTPATAEFFQVVERLANNWQFVRESYKLGHQVFRNDLAFDIAARKVLGSIPGFSLFYRCDFQRTPWDGTHGSFDVHAMHKTSLLGWYSDHDDAFPL